MATSESSKLRTNVRRFRRATSNALQNRKFAIGLILVGTVILGSLIGPEFAPYSPTEPHLMHKLEGPSSQFLLGTDHLGRDLLTRVLSGGQTSLFLGLSATLLGLLLGVPIGLISGYAGGRIDEAIMRLMDTIMSFPSLLLALLILTTLSASVWNAIMAIGIVYAPRIARIVRGSTLSVKQEEFIQAARVTDESDTYIMFGEILPNILSPIIVEGSIRVGFAILVGTALSFLGLGAQPPNADWGYMIAEARHHVHASPWFLIWPSIALALTIIGFNLFGDGLRDVLDPQTGSEQL